MELSLGAIAGALAQIFTIPVAVIATRQQVGKAKSKGAVAVSSTEDTKQVPLGAGAKGEVYDDSFLAVAREVIHEDGITGLWSGLRPGLVLTINPAITYGVFERVKSIFTLGDSTAKLGPWRSFCVGALSKTLATIVSSQFTFWYHIRTDCANRLLILISWRKSAFKLGARGKKPRKRATKSIQGVQERFCLEFIGRKDSLAGIRLVCGL